MQSLHSYWNKYLVFESGLINKLSKVHYINQFIHDDKISGRITLYLLVVGTFALLQEIYISIEMYWLSRGTYNEINLNQIDNAESFKLYQILMSDDYHSKEYKDLKSGIMVEEFESRENFYKKPVFVSQISVNTHIVDGDGRPLIADPIKYHLEFLPSDYDNERRVEFGCSLNVLRTKLYHLVKDSPMYHELKMEDFRISNHVHIYNKFGELLTPDMDRLQLCFLKMETGDTIKCDIIVST
ncbi:Erg29p KNAG_0E02150 [Huiozyma naganishii CBS 8797]|uniref:Uncharacterized protein n=1 Tax=Huiozyma naganishii (strain ATCC MYA-139 / BCRC 22969 / CBS 8797 / KCTC 17520 / NBRC 10181 / NCYC 3082 / Yp74L-3) TaxID=1071383 RepID=J7S7T2_HUIN7|nr:hypothetical protein KNAG_0E02150 [Kazachstania naganishii CBS 8797]CCK70476.1 hypothetical protein KNAG_0E02150 [Kazachstania naganishii CBS 8797]